MKKILYMHCGSGNHGCEALVRTTSMLLNGPENVGLWSFCKSEDMRYGAAGNLEYIAESEELPRFSPAYLEAMLKRTVLRQQDATFKVFLKHLFRGNIAVSIGGDNYCYPWSAKQLIEWNREIRKYAKASVLWGCSIDPEAVTPEMAEDLAGYDLITAREPLTYDLLKPINPNTQLVADPAFLLPTVKRDLPKEFIEGNTVGINVSPMIMDYGTDRSLILESYAQLIRDVLENTDMSVALIPHVVWKQTDDRIPLSELYKLFETTGRVCMIEDANAVELKGYIARCRFFVGARTHATIAAYSSGVPTLVVGYSVKSRGIAKDLFGDEENYVLPVQGLKTPAMLTALFAKLMQNEIVVRDRLTEFVPEYQKRAEMAKHYIDQLV